MPEDGPPRFFYIVYRGKGAGAPDGRRRRHRIRNPHPGPRRRLPDRAISAERRSTNSYIAVEDSYCFQLPAADFLRLQELSPSFQIFCTRYIASLMSQSREQLQAQFSQRAAEQQTMTTSLANLVKKAPIFVSPDVATRGAPRENGRGRRRLPGRGRRRRKPVGVLTQSDILKRIVLTGFDLTRPIADVMTTRPTPSTPTPAPTTPPSRWLPTACATFWWWMPRQAQGRDLRARPLSPQQRIGLRQIRSGIESAADVQALQRASRDIRQLALNLLAQGIGAEQLTQFISALNDALTRRILEPTSTATTCTASNTPGSPSAPKAVTSRPSPPTRTTGSSLRAARMGRQGTPQTAPARVCQG